MPGEEGLIDVSLNLFRSQFTANDNLAKAPVMVFEVGMDSVFSLN